MQSPGKNENVKENPCQSEKDALTWDRQLCQGQWQWRRKGLRQLQEIQRRKRESRRTSETPQGTWLGGARKGSLWLCYAGPLIGRQKSGISGKRRGPKLTPWVRNSWGS